MVSWVLLVDTMRGRTVAPGCHDSSISWLCSLVQKLKQFYVVHLYRPPPITSIHVTIHLLHLPITHIVALQSKNQVLHELRISVDCTDTIQDVVKIKLETFISNVKVLAFEQWVAGQLVKNWIEFICSMIWEAKPLYKLKLNLATHTKKKGGDIH